MDVLNISSVFFIILRVIGIIKSSSGMDNDSVSPTPRRLAALNFQKGYESRKPPHFEGNRVTVYFKLFVRTVAPIISSDMEFRVNMRMTMSWEDKRISLNVPEDGDDDCRDFVIVPPEIVNKIWHPDPYIPNAKYTGIKKFLRPLVNMNVFENNTVSYTMIWNATVACSMNFAFYPLDIQLCPMLIQSFTYDDTVVEFKWDPNYPFIIQETKLIQFFVAVPPPTSERLYFEPGRGKNFTQLVATFRFERLIGNLLVLTFTPTSLIVTLSWFSFWLELDCTAARGSLLMISILTLVTHFTGMTLVLPPVAYVKAVDVWIFGCIFWVFAALAEFVIVKVVYSITEEVRRENQVYSVRKSTDDKGLFLRVTDVDRPTIENNNGASQVNTYTAFWLWDELRLSVPTATRNVRLKGHYMKNRLGSVVLSGRSAVTINLPRLHKQFGKWTIPLIWEDLDKNKKLLWKEIDKISKWLFPISFTIFCVIFWAILLAHSYFA